MNRHQRRAGKHAGRPDKTGVGTAGACTRTATQLCQQGRYDEAAALYRQALALAPNDAQIHNSLANALRSQGHFAAAIDSYRSAIALKPAFAEAANNLGVTLQQEGDLAEAIAAYRSAIHHNPGFAEAHDNLGLALCQQGDVEAAIACHRRALELMPDIAETYNHLGVALRRIGARDEAIACYQQAIRLKPDLAAAHNNLGVALHHHGQPEAEMTCYRSAIRHKPDYADAHANLGVALQEQGELDASYASFRRAVALAPRRGDFHRMLVETGRIAADDPAVRRLEAIASASVASPDEDRIEAQFALGLLHASAGHVETALGHLLEANRLQRGRMNYDEAATLASFDLIRETFTREILLAGHGGHAQSDIPIFVVGMPRSGTTLVEQILASHPSIHGAGEVADLQRLAAFGRSDLVAMTRPDWRAIIQSEKLAAIGADYLGRLTARAPSAVRIVDKMPDNFLLLGLIRLALPGARIIHVARNPLDTCMSCFSRLFATGVAYSYDLAELGRYYLAYRDLMVHWYRSMPPNAMLTIRYEELVTDPQGQVARLLGYCGVAWDDDCLAFHRNTRPVRTASATQVRQPLYRNAVGRWQAVAEKVMPLLDPCSKWATPTD
jgi:tetratricopeptide (TPR) repeat protein